MKHFSNFLTLLFATIACAVGGSLAAQTTHVVTVVNFEFIPANLFVEAGDTVVWINEDGFHNVNGTTETYPDNPESFTSGSPAAAPWSYSRVFDTPGTYDYRCDAHPGIMQATVDVGIDAVDNAEVIDLKVFPNPASESIQVRGDVEHATGTRLVLLDITGKEVLKSEVVPSAPIDISSLNAGIYFYGFVRDGVRIHSGKLFVL